MMQRVDCWRLLGVAPDASAAEVRAAYARRVRDAHPDSGGTGDGLTLRLLREARDEAVARSEGKRGEGRGGGARREGERQVCAVCRRAFPGAQLAPRRTRDGGHALVCFACRVEGEAKRARAVRLRAALAILGTAALLAVAAVAALG
jgi:hypothetical protein